MRIAIDGRELCGRATGVGRYLRHLLEAWAGLPEAAAHQFVLYLPAEAKAMAGGELPTAKSWAVRRVPGGPGTWWEQVRLPAALRHDDPQVLFAPAYTAPISGAVPVVLTIHDLSYVAHPEWFPARTRLRRRVLSTLAARRARVVITDAEFSRGEVVRLLGVPPEKVRVIPLGVTAPGGGPAGRGFTPANARSSSLVLFVGSIFNRRHLPELIQAFAALASPRPGLRLEIVGDNRTYPPQDLPEVARRAGVEGSVTIRSYVPDAELAALYARAGLFVFLSDYEGFGLTPLEALAAGVPILVGDTRVAREVYGDAAAFVSTSDVGAIARQIDRLLHDAAARSTLLDRAPAVLARYSWELAGRATLHALLEAARA